MKKLLVLLVFFMLALFSYQKITKQLNFNKLIITHTKKTKDNQLTKNTNFKKNNKQFQSNFEKVTVSRPVDGDTVYVEFTNGTESKIRFIGVNTPENTTKIEPYGKESSKFTEDQLLNKTVYLEKDISERDKYNRLLRYVWLEIPPQINENEVFTKQFNAILVKEGYAKSTTYPPDVKYKEYYLKFQNIAKQSKKGLWQILKITN